MRELSRMLGGLEDSTLAQDHAEELLATAAAAKTEPGLTEGRDVRPSERQRLWQTSR